MMANRRHFEQIDKRWIWIRKTLDRVECTVMHNLVAVARTGVMVVALMVFAGSLVQAQRPPMTPEQAAAAAARRQAEMSAPRPIAAVDSVWMEELTWMEVRDAIKAGKTTALILTGGVESNGPHLATGKHNYVLTVMGESIARSLGNALVAPIVTMEPGRPESDRVAPGSVFLSPETFEAVLTDMALSLKSMGFTDIIMMGDSGGNQNGMKNATARLNTRFNGTPARFFFVPEYYNYPEVRKFVQGNGVPEQMAFEASSGSDNIHEEYGIDAIMMLHDPATVRLEQRKQAGKTTINGADLLPLDKTLAMGRRIVELRTRLTVDAIRKAMAAGR
jgi:creatinine amidohydrolase